MMSTDLSVVKGDDADMCGVIITLGMSHRGLSIRQRLQGGGIKPGSRYNLLLQRPDQRLFVDDLSPGNVDQIGSRLHQPQFPFSKKKPRLRRDRNRHDDEVRLLEQSVDLLHCVAVIDPLALNWSSLGATTRMPSRLHRSATFNTDVSQANDPHGLANRLANQAIDEGAVPLPSHLSPETESGSLAERRR